MDDSLLTIIMRLIREGYVVCFGTGCPKDTLKVSLYKHDDISNKPFALSKQYYEDDFIQFYPELLRLAREQFERKCKEQWEKRK